MDAVKSIFPIQNPWDVKQLGEPKTVPDPLNTALTVHEDEAFNKNDSEADFSMAAPEQSSRLESLDLNALVAMLSKDFIEEMSQQRDMTREARNSQREQMVQAATKAVEKMKSAALTSFAGQIAANTMTIVGGAVAVGGASNALSGLSKGTISSTQAHALNNRATGVSQIMGSVGGIASSTTDMVATTEHTAAQTILETKSDVHRLQSDDSAEYFRDAVSIIREAQNLLKELYAGMSQANSAVIENTKM